MIQRCTAAYRGPMLFPKYLALTEGNSTPGHHAVPVPREVNQGVGNCVYIGRSTLQAPLFYILLFAGIENHNAFQKNTFFVDLVRLQFLGIVQVLGCSFYILHTNFNYFFSFLFFPPIAWKDPLYFYKEIPIPNLISFLFFDCRIPLSLTLLIPKVSSLNLLLNLM